MPVQISPFVLVGISPLVPVRISPLVPVRISPFVPVRIAQVFVAPLSSVPRSLRGDYTPPEEVLLALGRLSRAYHLLEFYDELSETKSPD